VLVHWFVIDLESAVSDSSNRNWNGIRFLENRSWRKSENYSLSKSDPPFIPNIVLLSQINRNQ